MITLTELMKRVGCGGRMVPFFKAVAVYWAVGGGSPSATGAAAKCAPVLCLLLCVFLRDHSDPERRRYARCVACGLALSALGDVLLVWPHYFVPGMAAFAGAHVAYIAAFGATPRAPALALACFTATLGYLRLLSVPVGILVWLVPIYSMLLAAMAWRGAARGGPQRPGALLFLVSDAILGYSLFAGPVPYKQVLVMTTYYLGQLCIALSALEPLAQPAARSVAAL